MAPTTAKFAAHLRAMRIRSGLTQTQFARKLGVSQQKLSDWENGKHLRAMLEAIRVLDVLERM